MKFSLRTMLLTLCLLGAAVGMMGNWLIRSPETFLIVLDLGSTLLPFVLATGTIIWMGFKRQRRPGLITWGVLLLTLPFFVQGTLMLVWPTRDPLRMLSSQRLIETRLPARISEPWVWNELDRRLAAGNLFQQDVDAALKQLIAMMTSTSPQGWNQPLSWQNKFIRNAVQANMVSAETFLELCDAFYGPQPVVSPLRPVLRNDGVEFNLNIAYGSPWSNNSGLGVELLWNVTNVSLDGTPVSVKQVHRFAQSWSGFCEGVAAPGDHEITIDVECAYVDNANLTAMNASALPVAQWPTAVKRWTKTIAVPVTIEPQQ